MSSLTIVDRATDIIDQFRGDLEPLLEQSGKSFDRIKSVFLIAVQQNPDILKCTPESLRREVSKCAADGLVPDSKEAVLLPYYDNKEKVLLANYQPMVYGLIKRTKELGGVFNIVCNLVYAKDHFELDEADPDSLSHKADRFSKDRGEIVGGYVVFRDEHKRLMHLETMSLEDFEKVRQASKAPDSPAWRLWREEMYRKAVLRRGAKYISINNDKLRALIERQDDMFDFQQPRVSERVDPFGKGDVIEHRQSTAIPAYAQHGLPVDTQTIDSAAVVHTNSNTHEDLGGTSEYQSSQDKKEELKSPPAVPEVFVKAEDNALLVEACEKILAIPLDKTTDGPDKRGTLKFAASHWAKVIPEYARPLIKACIDTSDWAIKQSIANEPWTGDHAMFVHGVKTLLGVERLKIGSYP